MRPIRTWGRALLLGVGFLSLLASTAYAVITRLTPLKEVLNSEQLIFSVKVDKLDPDKPSVIFRVEENLKGKAPFEKLPVNLTADSEGQREQHTVKLLKRLAADLELVVFTSKRGKKYTAFGYTNGTWFQMLGQVEDDPAKVRWSFAHCEPYLRRTFKGTTDELKEVIRDGLAGKKMPPEPNAKEPPGLGPEIKEQKDKSKGKSAGIAGTQPRPLFAVIPTFVIVGPIALLATLFPAIFGGLALLLRRWVVMLTIASLDSTLFFLHGWFHGQLKDSWLGSQTALWGTLTVVTLAGVAWSSWRHRQTIVANPEAMLQPPQRIERFLLGIVSITGLVVVCYNLARGNLFKPPWKELLVIWSVAWIGALYTYYLGARAKRQNATNATLPSESIMLGALVLACAGLSFTTLPRKEAQGAARVVWTFEPAERGAILSSPLIYRGRVYIAAVHSSGLSSYGAVYRVDRQTGKEVWRFDDDGGMQQVFSTPCLEDGRLFIGEGLHENRGSRFFCLNADTGKELWRFETTSHTESSPCLAGGRVFFGAGDDGLYCLDASTGKEIWRFKGPLHIDANPLVVGDRLYCGSGTSRNNKTTQIFCLDTKTGNVHWRQDTDLAVWGSPASDGACIYFGLGNGRMDKSAESPETPAGALLCVDPSGKERWRFPVDDAVLVKPAVDDKHVYFGARDRQCYALDKMTGKLVWKCDLGSPVVTAPALLEKKLYVVASEGKVACLDAATGKEVWPFDVAAHAQAQPQLYSSPAAVHDQETRQPRIYFGAGLQSTISTAAVLYCIEGPG